MKRPGKWWKTFAIGAAVWLVGTLGIYVSDPSVISVASITDVLLSAFFLCALLGYAFQRRVFVRGLWQATVPIAPVWDVAYPVFLLPPGPAKGSFGTATVVGALFVTVALLKYLALFRYAYRSPRIWTTPEVTPG